MLTDPTTRFERIGNLIQTFCQTGVLSNWDLKVNPSFAKIKAKQLYHPQVLDPENQARRWEDYE
jgi:hypothetical protein